jgi:hypothetical protein
MSNAEERRKEIVKEVFFIHQNTRGVKVGNRYTQITTDYVCARGFKDGSSETIYNSPDKDFDLENAVPGVWWDSYEEGEKALASLLKEVVVEYSDNIKGNFDKLKEKYPEVMI